MSSELYYTHRPFLIKELEQLKNLPKVKILEFGVGDGSSLIFNEYASKYKHFNIQAYETDTNWLINMREKYQLNNYIFQSVENWESFLCSENFDNDYDLVFIDQAPWEARIQTLDLLAENARVTILHDYDFFNKGITPNIYEVGNNTFFEKYNEKFIMENYHETLPPTLVFKRK